MGGSVFQQPAKGLARLIVYSFWLVAAGNLLAQEWGPANPPALGDIRQQARAEVAAFAGMSLDIEAMGRLSLMVSGLGPEAIAPYQKRLETLVVKARTAVADSSLPLGEALLQYLHGPEGVFKRYLATQTRLDRLLESGNFNCVSSALLYLLVGRALGLDVSGIATSDHAFCVIRQDGKNLDVETTIAYGYDPGRRQDFRDNFGKLTGFVWVPSGNYSLRRPLDDQHFAELVLQNLAVEAQDRRDTITPIGLAWDSASLVGLLDAMPLLTAAYHNRAAQLNDQGKFLEALAVALTGESLLGQTADTQQMIEGIAGNYINIDLRRGDWAAAHRHLALWRPRLGAAFTSLSVNLFRLESQDVHKKAGWTGLQTWLTGQGAQSELSATEVNAAWEMGITNEIARLSRSGEWEASLAFLNSLSSELQRLPAVTRARVATEHNIVAAYHNRFAALANAKKTQEARSVLEEALARFPDNALLKQDKSIIGTR